MLAQTTHLVSSYEMAKILHELCAAPEIPYSRSCSMSVHITAVNFSIVVKFGNIRVYEIRAMLAIDFALS